jgi:hypothetical protein
MPYAAAVGTRGRRRVPTGPAHTTRVHTARVSHRTSLTRRTDEDVTRAASLPIAPAPERAVHAATDVSRPPGLLPPPARAPRTRPRERSAHHGRDCLPYRNPPPTRRISRSPREQRQKAGREQQPQTQGTASGGGSGSGPPRAERSGSRSRHRPVGFRLLGSFAAHAMPPSLVGDLPSEAVERGRAFDILRRAGSTVRNRWTTAEAVRESRARGGQPREPISSLHARSQVRHASAQIRQ